MLLAFTRNSTKNHRANDLGTREVSNYSNIIYPLLQVRCQRLEDEVRDLKLDGMVMNTKLSNCAISNQSKGVPVIQEKHNSGNLIQMKNGKDFILLWRYLVAISKHYVFSKIR